MDRGAQGEDPPVSVAKLAGYHLEAFRKGWIRLFEPYPDRTRDWRNSNLFDGLG